MAPKKARDHERRVFNMLVKVSVPAHLNAEDARAEVRSLLKHQCSVKVDEHEVHMLGVKPVPVSLSFSRKDIIAAYLREKDL